MPSCEVYPNAGCSVSAQSVRDKDSRARLERLLRFSVLGLACVAAFFLRLFSVVRFESVIHEFDPWFNFRATRYLTTHGIYNFWNWFDERSWYPLGRVVGGTVYPGLMVTAAAIHRVLHLLNFPLDIRNVCVFMAPAFSMLATIASYLLAAEVHSPLAGLFSAGFMAIAPGYISRSVAGSYDNECIAIFLLVFCFYLWLRAQRLGSAFYGAMTALVYFYMVAAWGGYAFITNMIPLHAFALILMGRYSLRLYTAYCSWYVIGTLMSFTVPFVGFAPVSTSEHMSALGIFGLMQLVGFTAWVRTLVSGHNFAVFLRVAVVTIFVGALTSLIVLTKMHVIMPWTGRFYSLWDTAYAAVHMPIISSVSEHQATAWSSFYFDLHMAFALFPAGVLLCFRRLQNGHVFVIVYAIMASYFAGVMVRLVLTLTPVVCCASGIAIASVMESLRSRGHQSSASDGLETPDSCSVGNRNNTKSALSSAKNSGRAEIYDNEDEDHDQDGSDGMNTGVTTGWSASDGAKPELRRNRNRKRASKGMAISTSKSASESSEGEFKGMKEWRTRMTFAMMLFGLCTYFVRHCTWVTSIAYSSPSVVLASGSGKNRMIIDDFREAYYWLRRNTPENATVMSWWDYGYQLAGMADRTTIVDNNTWNNTHIATVGRAMSSSEDDAYPVLQLLDVDYVLVIFGGLIGYSGDDINKFLWMIRIGQGVYPEHISESKFFTKHGEYRVDDAATPTMRNSLMYKMSYYRFNDLFNGQIAQDRVRNQRISSKPVKLHTLDEAYTSEHWIVRIYKVRKPDFLGRHLRHVASFNEFGILRNARKVSKKETTV